MATIVAQIADRAILDHALRIIVKRYELEDGGVGDGPQVWTSPIPSSKQAEVVAQFLAAEIAK